MSSKILNFLTCVLFYILRAIVALNLMRYNTRYKYLFILVIDIVHISSIENEIWQRKKRTGTESITTQEK